MVGDAKLEMREATAWVPASSSYYSWGQLQSWNTGFSSCSDYNPNSWPCPQSPAWSVSWPPAGSFLAICLRSHWPHSGLWPPSVLEDAKPFPASETCHLLDLLHGNILPVSAQTFIRLPCSPFQSAFIRLPLSYLEVAWLSIYLHFCCPSCPTEAKAGLSPACLVRCLSCV